MAASFNLTAQLNLRGPSNIRNIVSNIRRQLGTISGDINFNINPATTRNVAQLNSALQGLNQTFAQTATAARNASTAIAAFSASANAGNINNVATNLNNVSAAANNTAQSVTRASRQTAVARTEMEEFGRQSALAVRRFAAFSVSTGAIVGLSNAIRKGIAAFIEYDRQLVVLQQVTGESANGLAKLSSTVTSLSTGLGVASADLLSVSSTLAQAGLSARDTERALKALALSALAPSFDNLNKTVEGSIALMRQFGISAKDLESSLGSVNAVAAAFAVESADIIAAIQRTGGVFAAASKGVSEGTQALNEFIAIFTSVRQTTRESAETIATGLRTIFTRIQRGGTIEALKEFGVNLTDVEGKFVGAYRAVQLLSEGLNRIDPRDIKFSQIVEELGGFRQIGKVIPLIQQFATAQQALAVAQAGAGSLAEDAAIAQLSLANKITKVREEFLALFREIGSSDSFQTIARGALDVASALIRVADSVKGVLPVLGIMMAMRGASAITQFGAGFIGGIRRGGGAAGLGGRMAGGFASGGYVAGSGNRDTVPAMLTPGEFVMRKKAVKQIGVGKLARLNRNGGGPVQYLNSGGVVQKFATGGVSQLAALSPGIGSSRIDKYIDDSRDIKKRKKNIQSQDMVSSTIVRRQITKKDIGDINQFRKNISQRTGLIQNSRGGNKYSVEGLAFENWLWDNIPYIKAKYNKAPTKTYPLDLIPKAGARPAEIKFTGEQVPDPFILNKRLRYHLLNFGDRGGFTRKIDKDVKLGPTLVYELAPGLKDKIYYGDAGPSRSTLVKRGQRNLEQQEKLKRAGFNRKNIGGYIQRFMAGQFVKPAKKPKTVSPADLFVGPGGIDSAVWTRLTKEALTSKQLKLGATGRTIVFPNGQEIDFKKALDANPNITVRNALSSADLQPGELRKKFTDLYNAQRAGVVAATGNRSPAQIAGARSQNLLFGIAGMFGKRFSPKPLNLTTADGLKQNTSAVVFGSVLDQNNIEKQARLASRKQRLEALNARRSNRGKQPLQDTTLVDRMVAPTAQELSGSFQKGAAATIARQNKKLAIDSVSAIAATLSPSTGGSRIFLDFDRTLSFGSDKIGSKTNKKKPDYTAFGIPSEVSAGLKNAKLSNLGSKLISIVGGLDSKSPGLGRELLRKMFVVSARPQNTMPLIARWLRNKGLRIPPSNVVGVGAPGLSPDAIAINKAEQMVKLGGGPGSVFIDDDPRNVSAARERGISSIRYGFKLDKKDPLARQQAATEEGYQFEKFVNDNLPPSLKRAFFKAEGEGIDFPAGLDPQIAKYWFNDSRLVGVPVDTKRTVGGPSTIKDNVISYLKERGYASGGIVQKFSNGMEVDYVPGSAMAALKALAREFITPKSRKGGKRKVSFLTQKAVSLSKNIPPELLKEIEREGRLVSGTGIGDLPRGDMGLVVDKIVNVALARVKKRKAGQLKKTEGALTFSAAGLQRGPRAPAGQMEKALAKYQQDPQYRAAMGLDSGVAGGFLKQFEALAKAKNFTSPKSLLEKLPGAKSQISEFRSSLQQQLKTATDPKEIKSLQDQIKKATTALDDFDSYMMGASPRNAGRASHFAWAMRQAVPDAARFAQGGLTEAVPQMSGLMKGLYGQRTTQQKQPQQDKKPKDFGKIGLRSSGSEITATYFKNQTREGFVSAKKAAGNLFTIGLSKATKGYGPRLYDIVMEAVTAQGGMLTSDRNQVSEAAKSVWAYYFKNRGDVRKTPLDPSQWTKNQSYIDPKLYGKKETWPPNNDPAWILQTGYSKSPALINSPDVMNLNDPKYAAYIRQQQTSFLSRNRGGSIYKFAKGGSSQDMVDALVSNGEAYIPPKLAQKIGRSKLDKMNQADRNGIAGFSDGGISVFKGPGNGTSDSIRTRLPVGAYILREKATKALGLSKGGSIGGVQRFAVGGAVDTAVAAMSPKDAARLKASIAKNAQAFEQLERMVAGWPIKDVEMALKKLDRSLEKGATTANALASSVSAGVGSGGSTRTPKKGILQQSAGLPENRNITNPVGPRGFAASQARLNQIAQNTQQYNRGAAIAASRTTTSGMMGGQIQMSQAGQQYAASLQKNSGILNKLSQILGITSKTQQQVNQSSQRLAQAQTQAATATAAGGADAGDNKPSRMDRLKNAAFGLSFAIPMIADMMTVAEPKNAQQAATNAQMTGISTAVGSATMLASMGPLGVLAAIPTAVGGIVKAFADAKNAAHEFNKQAQSTKLEEALEKSGEALDKYSNNVKDAAAAEKARVAVLKANREAQTLSTMQQEPRASMMGMIFENSTIERLLGTSSPDNMAMQRSQILEQKGIMSYLGSIGFGGGDAANRTAVEFRSLIPQLAKENAKTFQGAAEASSRFLETQFKSGQTVDSMAASGQLNEFGRSLALADIKVQEYMMAVDNTVGLSDAQKNAMKENIIATQTEAKAREIQTRALREKALETLNRQTTQLQNSLERMFQNMEQAINSNAYSLSKLSDSAELTAASLSGAARAGTVRVDAINALNNPRAVSAQQRNAAVTQAASMFGSQAPEMEGVLKLSGMLENTLMSTINNTIKAANASGTAVTQEAIGAKLESSINQALSDLQLPPELATGLSREVKDAVQKMRTSGEDQVDFSEIINQVPQLGRVLESSRRAQELANKALEYWQQNLNEYANAMNNLVETQVDINSRLRRSTDILISGQLALGKALGQSVSLQTSVALIDQKRATQTPGGVTDPNTIGLNIRNLERLRSTQEAQAQEAAQKGFGGKDEFVNMQNNLANTNLALRENYASLKDMSENTDKANAAMERISELRAKTQAGVGIAERLVTSSPQELANLNRSMALLNNNMRGGLNVGSTAEDRKGVLDVFNMIAPFLGERQDALKANVLESMLRESGIGVNNMMQGVLDSLRNPAGDPQMAQAINIYNQGVNEQVKANQQLANLAAIMNDNNAEIAAQKIATAIQGVQLSFETQTLSNINDGIQQLVGIAQQKPPGNVAGTLARGGVVYAAEGQHINFKTKGTDTVPAMLTPGEFVVNRSATQKNLPLLQSINNGYQRGGKVSYYQDGGLVFGGRWGLAKNMDAQSTIHTGPELESKEKLSGLNWNELFSISPISVSSRPLPKNDSVGSVAGFVGFAGGQAITTLLDSVPIKNGDRGNFGGGLSLFPATYAYDKLTLNAKYRGEAGFNDGGNLDIKPRDITASPSLNIFDIPNLDFVQKVLSTSVNTSFSNRIKKSLAESIAELYSSIPNIKDNGNSFVIGNKTILKTANQNTQSITPTYSVSQRDRSLEIIVDNLGKQQYFGNDILLDDIKILQDAQRGVHKNATGSPMPVGVAVESRILGDFNGQAINAGIGNSPVLTGPGKFWLGGQNIWSDVYEKLYNPVKLDIFSSMTGMNSASKLQQLVDFKTRLKNAYETVNKASFIESSTSTGRKALINKMRNLLRGSSFQEIFDANEISGGVPTTLFNLSDDMWSQLQFPNSPPGTYATNKNSWIPIGMLDTNGFFTSMKSFPWVREGFKDTETIMSRKAQFIKQVGDLIKVTQKSFVGPNMSFPYKQINGPLWNQALGTFNDIPSSFNIIDTFSGDLNPFKGLQLDTNTQAVLADTPGGRGDINAFIRQILDSNSKTGKFKLNIASKLSKNDPVLAKADYTENTKSNAFINTLTKSMEFEPVEYQKVLDKVKEEQRVAQREQMVGQAAGAAQQAANFDAAKRVALGRLIYKTARQNKIPIRSRIPEDITHLPAVSEALQQAAQNSPSDYVRTLAAGTKTLIDQLADVNNDGSFFLQNGININTAFNPNNALRKNIRLPDGTFLRNAIYDYKGIAISPESILALIQRTGLQTRLTTGLGSGINAAAGLGAAVEDRDKAGLNLKGIKVERVNPETGKLEEQPFVKAGEDVLKWGNLFDIAFNPYAQFPDIQGRQSLFAKFSEKFNTATMPGTRRPAFDKRLLAEMNRNLTLLSQWYGRYQDYLINTTDTPDISAQKKTKLDASTTIIKDRELAQDANRFYTNNKFGELPTYEWLQAKLDQKINPADAQVKNAVGKATGGLIYASDGALINFQPKGTDTVPAMLTPGEFVVNREATKKHLPLLKNINMATGGMVQYRRNGGQMYDSSTGTFSRSEGVVDQILSKVESGNRINEFTYGNTNKNLAVSRNTNTLASNINEDTSKLRSSVKNATGYASGGMIYANNGMLVNFQPKGTDTIPAMLSPGEFVVRREATQKHLSLLHAINNNSFSGDSALTLNRGGYIQPAYLSRGGFGVPSLASLPDLVSKMAGGIQSAVEKAITQAFNNIELPSSDNNTGVSSNKEIANQISSFANNLSNLANRLESISVPPEITITGKQDINVNANGLQVLSSLNPSLGKIALNMIKTAIDNLATKNPGTLDFNIEYPQGQ